MCSHAHALRLGDEAPQNLGGRHVRRVRSHRRADAPLGGAIPRLDEGHGLLERDAADLLVIADAEVAPGEQRLHAALLDHRRDLVHPEVVIAEADRAAAEHFGGGEGRAPRHILGFEG